MTVCSKWEALKTTEMIKLLLTLATSLFNFIVFSSETCDETFKLCSFLLPKYPIYNALLLYHTGVSQSECLMSVKQFDWSIGLYCEPSAFCGVGLDVSRDYSSLLSGEILPVNEMCHVIIHRERMECHDILPLLYELGILRGLNKL